jgi:hypothetical protein
VPPVDGGADAIVAGDLRELAGQDRAADRVDLDLAHAAHAQPGQGEVEAADAGEQRQERRRRRVAAERAGGHTPHTPWQSLPNPSGSAAVVRLGCQVSLLQRLEEVVQERVAARGPCGGSG